MAMENQPAANVFSVSSGYFPLPGQVRLPECRNQFPCWTSPCLVIINLRIHFCWLSFFGSSNPHSSPTYPCSSNIFPAINLPSARGFPITMGYEFHIIPTNLLSLGFPTQRFGCNAQGARQGVLRRRRNLMFFCVFPGEHGLKPRIHRIYKSEIVGF